MNFNIQPTLENENQKLVPLQASDFEPLYAVSSDPKIWEQHPNNDRWKRDVFQTFFDGAIESKGAFKILDKPDGKIMGCTRFYEYNEEENSIVIGYTFYATLYWGKGINPSVKRLMLDYIFQFVSKVYFHIGAQNMRSQIAIGRLGARMVGERETTHPNGSPGINYVYCLTREEWLSNQSSKAIPNPHG